VLSGYFTPLDNQLAGTGRPVSPFGGDDRLRDENTPLDELPAAAVVPRFWLAAGAADGQDVLNAERFWHELRPRQPDAPLTLTPGGRHTMTTWRAQIPSMLTWMTPRLARAAHQAGSQPARCDVRPVIPVPLRDLAVAQEEVPPVMGCDASCGRLCDPTSSRRPRRAS
jgi:hypothetical protein